MFENHVFVWRLEDVVGLVLLSLLLLFFLLMGALALVDSIKLKNKKRKERKSAE